MPTRIVRRSEGGKKSGLKATPRHQPEQYKAGSIWQDPDGWVPTPGSPPINDIRADRARLKRGPKGKSRRVA